MPLADLKSASTAIEAWYAEEHGLAPAELAGPGTTVVADPLREESGSLLAMIRPQHSFLRVPARLVVPLRTALEREVAGYVADISWVASQLPASYTLDESNFHLLLLDPVSPIAPGEFSTVRRLGSGDREIFDLMQAACTRDERETGEIELNMPMVWGAFADGTLAAQAAFLYFGGLVADVGVLTHPEYRGRGHGCDAVAALCRWGLDNTDRAIIYRVADDNAASRALAGSLGFHPWCRFDFINPE